MQIANSKLQISRNSPGIAGRGVRARQRGISLIEAVGSMLILAFVTLGTVQLYRVGDKQQRTARNYSNAQTQNREAMRRILRTLRHGFGVQMGDATFTGTGIDSGTGTTGDTYPNAQIIVTVPHPSSGTDHVRFYLTGTTLYGQNGTDTAISIATGVQSIKFTYYKTTVTSTGTSTSNVSGSAPASATEVQIALVSNSGGTTAGTTSTETAYVELRNSSLGY